MSVTITNSRTGNITRYLDKVSIEQETSRENGKSSANKTTLTLDLSRYEGVSISSVAKEGDVVTVSSGGQLSSGKVDSISTTHKNLEHHYEVEIYDQLMQGIHTKFADDIIMADVWLCNNSNPNQSVAHQLAYRMGFTGSQINLSNVDIKIKYAHFQKGNSILAEFTELAQAVLGKVFVDHLGSLRFVHGLSGNDYTSTNKSLSGLKVEIKVDTVKNEFDGVQVDYDQFRIEEEGVIWKFIPDSNAYNEREDLSHSTLATKSESATFEFNYITDICLDIQQSPIELVRYTDGEEWVHATVERKTSSTIMRDGIFYYELDLTETGGTVKFFNRLDKEVYINRFHIIGKPLIKIEDNYVTYAKLSDHKNLTTIHNKFIQNEELAKAHALRSYNGNCFDRDKYSVRDALNSSINLKDLVTINSLDVNTGAVVERISHTIERPRNYTEVELEDPIINRSPNYVDSVENSSRIDWVNPYERPLQVSNLQLEESHRQLKDGTYIPTIVASWSPPARNYQGAGVYYRKISSSYDSRWNHLADTSENRYELDNIEEGYTYYIKVVSKGRNGNDAVFSEAPYVALTVQGKTENDMIVEWSTINWRADYISLNWLPVNDADFLEYEVRLDTNFGDEIN